MTKIRKNATKKIMEVLKIKKVFGFTPANNYKGEFLDLNDREIKTIFDDIVEGFANLYDMGNGQYKVQYAGKCHWIIG